MDTEEQRTVEQDHCPFIRVKLGSREVIYYSVLCKDYPEELRIRYEKELNETPEKKRLGLHRLKEIIQKEKLDNLDDQTLLAVLRSCKFNTRKAEPKLRSFIKYRRELLDKLVKIDMETVEGILFDQTLVGFLPYRDQNGRSITYTKVYDANFDKFGWENSSVCAVCMILFNLSHELSTAAGVTYFGSGRVPHFSMYFPVLREFKRHLSTIMSMPMRIKAIEFFDEMPIARWLVKISRPLVPEKVYKRVKFYGEEFENLHKSYHPDILPEEFGGNLGPLRNDFYKRQLLDYFAKLKAEGLQNAAKSTAK